jgi:hypothetical protein
MTDKTIMNARSVGGDYFRLIHVRSTEYKLDHYLDLFNPEDYWIYKSSNHFRQVTTEDLIEFKYAAYIFFRKDLYDYTEIDEWIEFILEIEKSKFNYLIKPFPPREMMDKINVIK